MRCDNKVATKIDEMLIIWNFKVFQRIKLKYLIFQQVEYIKKKKITKTKTYGIWTTASGILLNKIKSTNAKERKTTRVRRKAMLPTRKFPSTERARTLPNGRTRRYGQTAGAGPILYRGLGPPTRGPTFHPVGIIGISSTITKRVGGSSACDWPAWEVWRLTQRRRHGHGALVHVCSANCFCFFLTVEVWEFEKGSLVVMKILNTVNWTTINWTMAMM